MKLSISINPSAKFSRVFSSRGKDSCAVTLVSSLEFISSVVISIVDKSGINSSKRLVLSSKGISSKEISS